MNEFTLAELLVELRKNLKKLIAVFVIATAVGLVIAFSIPKQYSASISLAPELSGEKSFGGMSGLASLAGIDLNDGSDAIGPDLYPNVIATNKFLVDLLPIQVTTTEGDTCSFKTYILLHTKAPWWSYGKIYLGKLIKKLRSKKTTTTGSQSGFNPKYLSEEEEVLINALRNSILCNINDESGIIQLSVNTQDPLVATIMVDSVMMRLQDFITQYRTNKARNDLNYYLTLEDSARYKYDEAKRDYVKFCDSHNGVTLQSYISERETLENELQLAFNVYSQIKQQVQLAQAKVQEKTPAFTVLEDSSVPNIPNTPRKVLILFATVFVACLGFMGWIYFRLLFLTKESA